MPVVDEPSALITTFAPLPGGSSCARSLFALARLLRRRMHVDLIAPRRRGQRYTQSNGEGRVYRVPLGGVDLGPEAEGRFLRAVQRQLRAHAYDVVVVGDPLSALAVHHTGIEGLRIVYMLRELRAAEITDFGPRLQDALSIVDCILVPSGAAVSELRASGIAPEKVQVMPPYLELRTLIAQGPVPARKRLILLGFDRPARQRAAAAQLLEHLPKGWSLVVPSDGGQLRQELKTVGQGYDASRLELPFAWPTRRLLAQLSQGGVVVTLGRNEASAALDLPSGDELLARALCLHRIEMSDDAVPMQVIEAAEEAMEGDLLEPLSTEEWPRLADLLTQWLSVMGVEAELGESLVDTHEPTQSDSGSATRTDWVETDMSRVELTSSTHEVSNTTGVQDERP